MLLVVLMLAACGEAPKLAARSTASPSPVAMSPSPSLSASPEASPSPTPPVWPAVTRVAFSCRMPVSMPGNPYESLSGGFIDLPSATFVADHASAYVFDQKSSVLKSAVQPYLYGMHSKGTLFYERSRARWLPVPREAVSTDGTSYVYADPDRSKPSVHVVDIASGQEKTFPAGSIRLVPVPLDYSPRGIFLTEGWEGTVGLWKLDPRTGSIQKLADTGGVEAYQDGQLWYPSPRLTYGGSGPDTIFMLEVSSGKTTVWFERKAEIQSKGGALAVVGLDAQGHPVIARYLPAMNPLAEFWSVTSPGVETKIFTGEIYDKQFVLPDQHGLWFGAAGGLYLYSLNGRLQRVSDKAVFPAGSCI